MSTIFIGNISYDVTDQELCQLFSAAGRVKGFRFVTDKESGKSRGFGFMEFFTEEEAERAIETFNGTNLHGRTIKVDSADVSNSTGVAQDKSLGALATLIDPTLAAASTLVLKARQQKEIDKALKQVGFIHMYDVVFQLKQMISEDYSAAKKLMQEHPVLAQAMVRCCEIFKKAKEDPTGENQAQLNNNLLQMQMDYEAMVSNQQQLSANANLNGVLLEKILSLSPEEIAKLPEAERQRVLEIVQMHMQSINPIGFNTGL